MHNIELINCIGWDDFKDKITNRFLKSDSFRKGDFIFRGQRKSEWSLVSSFDRWFESFEFADRQTTFLDLLDNFKEVTMDHDIIDYNFINSDDNYLPSIAQHFGVPTRLLDWSESPYIAAFFAYSETISMNESKDDIGIWALDSKSKIWGKDKGVEILSIPRIHNTRIRNQYGKFTYLKTPFKSLEEYVDSCNIDVTPVIKYNIAQEEAKDALKDLDLMGISHSFLFPDIEGFVKFAKHKTIMKYRI